MALLVGDGWHGVFWCSEKVRKYTGRPLAGTKVPLHKVFGFGFCQGLSLAARMRPIARALLLLVLSVPILNTAHGQDRILLMNGEVISAKVLGQSTLEIRYLETRKNGLLRERAEATENVFSVIDSLGKEKVWYFHDTIFGNDLTPDQMRWFMNGERDARKGYKATWPMIEAFTISAGLTIGLNLETNAFFIPPLVGIAMILPRVHVAKGSISNPLMEGDEFYATGYARVGRTKRIIRSLIAGFVGVGVGLAANQLVINPNFRKP